MNKLVVVIVGILALAGLGAAAAPFADQYVADRVKAQIDADGLFDVARVEVGLFARSIALVDARSKRMEGVSAGRWQASGLDWPIGELLLGRTPLAGLSLGDPLRAERLEFDNLQFAGPEGQVWSVGSLVLEGLDLERYAGDVPSAPFQWSALGARILKALSLKRLEQRNMVYVAHDGAPSVKLARLVIEDIGHGKIGSATLAGLEASGREIGNPGFTVSEVTAKGLDLTRPLAVLADPAWRPGIPVGRVAALHASAQGFGGELLKRYGVALGSIATQSRRDGEVVRTNTNVDGFVLVPPSGEQGQQLRMAMSAMGLNELRLGLDCSAVEDRPRGEFMVDRCSLAGPDLGDISLAGKFVDADDAFWKAVDANDAGMLFETKAALASAKLVLADNGLLEHTLQAISAAGGQSPAAARANLAREIRRYQPPGVLITDEMTRLLDTAARFVEQGGTLTVEAKPDPPLRFDLIGSGAVAGPDIVGLLGLSASQSPAR